MENSTDVTLFPDLSDNLDGGFKDNYNRLPYWENRKNPLRFLCTKVSYGILKSTKNIEKSLVENLIDENP